MNETMLIATVVLVYMVVCILFEAIVIRLFRIMVFGRALWQSAVVNLVTLGMIYMMWPIVSSMDIDEDKVFPLLPILFLVTLLTESVLLMLLNKNQPWKRIMLATAVMNVVSYGSLYLIFAFI
jgi:hypothetical protein